MNDFVPSDWLGGCVDIQEIEIKWLDKPGPYGISATSWQELRSQMRDGDEIRPFVAPKHFWEHLAGRAGYALVRDGRAVNGVVTMMN